MVLYPAASTRASIESTSGRQSLSAEGSPAQRTIDVLNSACRAGRTSASYVGTTSTTATRWESRRYHVMWLDALMLSLEILTKVRLVGEPCKDLARLHGRIDHLTHVRSFRTPCLSHRRHTMFGALNRIIGRLDAEPAKQQGSQNPGDNTFGFQVLRNTNADLPLEPWFDFVIGLNGHFIVRCCHSHYESV